MQMELKLQNLNLSLASFNFTSTSSNSRVSYGSLNAYKAKTRSRETVKVLSSLPETAASVAVAATVVGAAATFLMRRTKSSESTEAPTRTCDDCGGSGVCSECKGEGFVLKRLSEESAERARLMSQNAATRYTAGLPKKWSYCTKCSSTRSCITCDGRGILR
ncbi:uncharacterized protein LOC131000084 isoform X2 [Salvia miltiorrhiza]|uniref:uncharacterized protein LOC131000084 isoform X2 n=1 Tax=Salvia miltiorrhiza TaxID=226208 RepID=UPI0025AC87A2|nr:uncharacterized protein LOC131000084 isoform X2 [Salvia miltiorrhiza]